MIVKSFPEKQLVESGKAEVVRSWGQKNIIMNAKATDVEYNNLIGPLSLKYTFKGAEWYNVDGQDLLIDQQNFLMLNAHQTYSAYIQSEILVDSFVLFFKDGIFKEVSSHHQFSTEKQLDNPELLNNFSHDFIEKRYRIDKELSFLLINLRDKIEIGLADEMELEGHFYHIVQKLLKIYKTTELEIEQLSFKKIATKRELYKRLHRAKDFIDASFRESIDLDKLAQVACLSKYHFLRVFKAIFKIPPHQYIQQKRLEKAYELLKKGEAVQAVCWEVGFFKCSFL